MSFIYIHIYNIIDIVSLTNILHVTYFVFIP